MINGMVIVFPDCCNALNFYFSMNNKFSIGCVS
jgi:hypothetical protein